MKIQHNSEQGSPERKSCRSNWVRALTILTILILSTRAEAQWTGRDGWVEEPAAKSLNVKGKPGHAYLDPSSVRLAPDPKQVGARQGRLGGDAVASLLSPRAREGTSTLDAEPAGVKCLLTRASTRWHPPGTVAAAR